MTLLSRNRKNHRSALAFEARARVVEILAAPTSYLSKVTGLIEAAKVARQARPKTVTGKEDVDNVRALVHELATTIVVKRTMPPQLSRAFSVASPENRTEAESLLITYLQEDA